MARRGRPADTDRMAAVTPVPRTERSAGIDIARGLALLGIIVVNARFFFLPFGSAVDAGVLPAGLDRSPADWAAHDAIDTLATFKFMSLFSLLFGFGLAQQAARAAAAGRSRWHTGLRRLGMLLVIGVLHGLLVWDGDILTLYAVLGTAVLACIGLDDRWLRRLTVGLVALTVLMTVVGAAMQAAFSGMAEANAAEAATTAGDAPDGAARGPGAMLAAEFDISSPIWIDAEVAAYREGPWLDAFAFRAVGYAISLAFAPFGYGWQALTMMLLGVWVQRSGLFGADGSARRRRIAWRMLAAGLPITVAAVALRWFAGREAVVTQVVGTSGIGIGALLLPLGYACLAVEFGPRLPAPLRAPIQAAGSIGLTVYLCESLACTALASWWGLAWFATMTDAAFTLLVVGVWAGLAVAALAWTRLVGNGPMERLWRWGTYG
jgi:uncharacterized protein